MKNGVSRRTFMKQIAAATTLGPLILPRLSFAAPANSRLQHAAIGVGGQGAHDLSNIFSSGKADIVALCDIDEITLKKAAELYPKARLYRDWREMLSKEEKNLDSVNVSTPDHTHAPASMTAIRKGKHVFCEKPLTHEVYETRQLTLAARKKGVATQMGIQCHAHEFYRTAVKWIKDGAIGKVKEWHSWSSARYTTEDKKRPVGADPIPPNVDWNLWLGTAPERPYKDKLYHPFWWRNWRDFGGGSMGDFGCHIFDPVFTALGIGAPLTLSCTTEGVSDEVWPGWLSINYVFPGTAMTTGKTIAATWHDGGTLDPAGKIIPNRPLAAVSPHLPKDFELPASGSIIVGEDGTALLPHFGAPSLYPVEKFKDYPKPTFEPLNHYHQFVEACLGNGKGGANFDFAGPLSEAVLLGNVVNRFPGKTLEWNSKKLKFTNCPEANKHLRRKYRKGWAVRGL